MEGKERANKLSALRGQILTAYLEERAQGATRREASEKIAETFHCTYRKVQSLVSRWKPELGQATRLNKNCRLTVDEEALTVGLILTMANLSKPMKIAEVLKIVNKRYRQTGQKITEHWARKFVERWSEWILLKDTRLISSGRSNENMVERVQAFVSFQKKFPHPSHATFNVDETRLLLGDANNDGREGRAREARSCSLIPFVSAAGECITVVHLLPTNPGQPGGLSERPQRAGPQERSVPIYKEYCMFTESGRYGAEQGLATLMTQFEKDFHQLYPGLPAVVYVGSLASCLTAELLSTLSSQQVFLVPLPPSPSNARLQQPLDEVFVHFASVFPRVRDEQPAPEPPLIDNADNGLLAALSRAFCETLKPGLLQSTFRDSGIFPWNPDLILQKATSRFGPALQPLLADQPHNGLISNLLAVSARHNLAGILGSDSSENRPPAPLLLPAPHNAAVNANPAPAPSPAAIPFPTARAAGRRREPVANNSNNHTSTYNNSNATNPNPASIAASAGTGLSNPGRPVQTPKRGAKARAQSAVEPFAAPQQQPQSQPLQPPQQPAKPVTGEKRGRAAPASAQQPQELPASKRQAQVKCLACSAVYRGSQAWRWCERCDRVVLCSSCQDSARPLARFEKHQQEPHEQ